jgi:sugar phosphate isomerase/epimerase
MYKLNLGISTDCFTYEWIDESKKQYKIVKLYDYIDAITKEMKANDFSSMELSVGGAWNLKEEEENFPAVKEFVEIIKKNGVKLNSVHLPFALPFWEFDSLDEDMRKLSVERAKWAIGQFEKGEPKYFVIHPGKIDVEDKEVRWKMMEQLRKSMQELCDSVDATICIENMSRGIMVNSIEEMLWLLEKVPKLMVVIDINHPFIDTPEDFIEKVGSRVKCLHVSDRDEIKERHNLPGDGILKWNKIIGALEKIGYEGEFTYEVSIRSKKYPLSLIRENYEKLFENYNNSKK